MDGYVEIKIVWNPHFQYGGCVSVEENLVKPDGERVFRNLRNGFFTRHEAMEWAEYCAIGKAHYIIFDDTLDVAPGWIPD